MLMEQYLKARYFKGVEEGRQEGRQEGRIEERQAWQAWYERMQTAQRAGQPFDEPPPAPVQGK